MITKVQDLVAKGEAAWDLVRELLLGSGVSRNGENLERFFSYLIPEEGEKRLAAVDLGSIFHFVLLGAHLILIPKARYAERDVVVLKDLAKRVDLKAECVEFSEGFLEKALRIDPNVFFQGYLRNCIRRGIHRDFLEE